ncbi:MAG: hypothetical protein AB7T59_05225 [Hyphomonadaceae bacterium]
MTMFEYVMVLVSIIIGLAMTHLLQGILDIIQERTRAYWVHLVWVLWAFTQAIFWWWWEFRFIEVETWTFPLFLFVIGFAFLVYLMCGFLFPRDIQQYGDYKTYFYARKGWFFGVFAVFVAVDLLDTFLKGADYFASLGLEYPLAVIFWIVGAIAGAIVRNERFHAVLAIAFLSYQFYYALRYFYLAA